MHKEKRKKSRVIIFAMIGVVIVGAFFLVNPIRSTLSRFGIDAGDIAAIILTHTDYDHVAAVSLFKTAQVYMSESNRIFLEGSAGRSRSESFIEMKRDFNTLKDGEAISIAGVQIQCIFTPGHTDGSVSYVVDGKYLFSGDNLNLKNGKAIPFNSVFNMKGDEQKQSLHRLSGLEGIDALFTMHTGYTANFKTALSEWSE